MMSGSEGGYILSYGLAHINTPRVLRCPRARPLLLFLDRHPPYNMGAAMVTEISDFKGR